MKEKWKQFWSYQRYLLRLERELYELEAKGYVDEYGTLYLIGPLF